MDFDSFYRVASHFQEEDDEALQKELKEAFRLYDKEGNGYIPTSSLREILAALDDQITPDQMDGMIAEIDTDGSGTVDFDGKRLVPLIEWLYPRLTNSGTLLHSACSFSIQGTVYQDLPLSLMSPENCSTCPTSDIAPFVLL